MSLVRFIAKKNLGKMCGLGSWELSKSVMLSLCEDKISAKEYTCSAQ
jgi:hypothetical protein